MATGQLVKKTPQEKIEEILAILSGARPKPRPPEPPTIVIDWVGTVMVEDRPWGAVTIAANGQVVLSRKGAARIFDSTEELLHTVGKLVR